eukprot:13746237-Alexandrium_andersonii.AAC.1
MRRPAQDRAEQRTFELLVISCPWGLRRQGGPAPPEYFGLTATETLRGLAVVAQDLDHLCFGCLSVEGGGRPWRIEADGGGWWRMEGG